MATLAARDQENAVRHLQSKSLNAKTPGNKAPKTPFKVPLNDENAVNKPGKSVLQTKGKASENLLFTGKKGGKSDDNAFVTPAGPRTRAPLGMKTTNAKSRAFATPAPLSSAKTQKVSPRLRRPKVKVHQPEAAQESEDDVPEIEYMPPKEIPLEDDMDDYLPKDWTIPKISSEAMARGIFQAYQNPIEDDGRTREQRKFEEEIEQGRKQRDEQFEKVFAAQMAKDDAETRRYFGVEEPKKKAPVPILAPKRTTTGPSTMRSRSAAAALSPPSQPNYAAPTASAKSRVPTGLVSGRKTPKPLAEPTTSRHASAAAASKSTIGYAQGRAGRTASAPRKPLSNITKPAPFSVSNRPASTSHVRSASSNKGPSSRASSSSTGTTLVPAQQQDEDYRTAEDEEREMELLLLSREDKGDEGKWLESFESQLLGEAVEEDEEDEFQFSLPEGF